MTREMNALFWWCINSGKEIKSVIFVSGFYNFNEMLQQDRVKSTEKQIKSPLNYAFSFDHARDLFEKIAASGVEEEDTIFLTEEEKKRRFETHKQVMIPYLEAYKISDKEMDDFIEICNYCHEEGIEIRLVIPPWWEGFYELCDEYDLMDQMEEYKQTLSKHVAMIDFEYPNCPLNKKYDDFRDYTHFQGGVFRQVSLAVINAESPYARKWKKES